MIYNAGVLDIVSMSALHDTCVVLPTLKHAIALWPKYRDAIVDVHGRFRIKLTRTSVVMPATRTALRLWVPYDRSPTMPMDWKMNQRGFDLVTPYGKGSWR